MILAAIEAIRVVVTVVNIVVSEAERYCRGILIGHANTIVVGVVDIVSIKISMSIAEIATPLVIPLLSSVDEEELRSTIVPRHILGDRGLLAVVYAKAVRIADTNERVVLLLILEAESSELKEILTKIEGSSPSLRAVLGGITILISSNHIGSSVYIIDILEVISSLKGNSRRKVVRSIDTVRRDIGVGIDGVIAVFHHPVAVNAHKEVFIRLPSEVDGVVHEIVGEAASVSCKDFIVESSIAAYKSFNRNSVPCLRELESL